MEVKQIRIKRTYEISQELADWLQEKAKEERRPVIKQVEVILEKAMQEDKEPKVFARVL